MRRAVHRNLLRLYEVLDPPRSEYVWVITEYCDGGQAGYWDSERCEYRNKDGGLMSLEDLSQCGKSLFSGLHHLQSLSIAHRDIKPENVLSRKSSAGYTFKLADFGESTWFEASNPTGLVTESRGTYQFFSPKACTGEAFSCFKADTWAAGAVLYCLAFGWLPFYSSDLCELFEMIESEPARAAPPGADSRLMDVLDAVLVKDDDCRPSCEEILEQRFFTGIVEREMGIVGEEIPSSQEHECGGVTPC